MNTMMMQAMQKLQEMQEKAAQTQAMLETMTVTTEAGSGMVRATANGKGLLTKLEIAPEAINADEKDMLEDLIMTATNKALDAAKSMSEAEMQKATQGMLPDIPGMNLPF